MDTLERELLWSSVARIFAADEATVSEALVDFGWADLLAAAPSEAVPAAFETAGAQLGPVALLDDVVAASVGLPVGATHVVYPLPSATTAGPLLRSRCAGRGVAARPLAADDATVTFADVDGRLAMVYGRAAGDAVTAVGGLDPFGGVHEVAFNLDEALPLALPLAGDAHATAIVARAAAHRALAHDLTGAAQQMLDLAVAHARERVQFGRAIGSFQAVQHRLADTFVSVTGARVALEEAWTAPGATTALLAKLWAGRAARTAARQSLQVLGGLGFTWEHPMHRYLRRVHVLDGLLGSSQQLARELGAEIRAAGHVPTLANL